MLHTSGMPQLSYRTEGEGPLVIMLHGLLMDSKSWADNGLISAFSPFFHVVCPDLPGHGGSEKPHIQETYTQQNLALSMVKMMDELGYEKAHIIGYSAGAWVTLGLLNFYPERCHSVILGGWDILNGLPEIPEGKLTFDIFMAYARETAPELTTALSSEDEKSAELFFNELSQYTEKEECLFPVSTPVLLWAGTHDPYYASMVGLAERQAISLIAGNGDHLSEVNNPDKTSIGEMLKFIQSSEGL